MTGDSTIASAVRDGWQPIETAPRDGSTFLIARAGDGPEEYEVGRYHQTLWPTYVEVEGGLFRRDDKPILDWAGFSNMHRATHWHALPDAPVQS